MRLELLGIACALSACAPSPVTDCVDETASFDVPGTEELTTFHAVAGGAGRFGRWVVGPTGLPEYAYTLDQQHDPAANWTNSEERTRSDHWHLVGNQRLNAAMYNDGYVQVWAEERGPELLDRYDPPSHNFGGGYSIVTSGGAPWSSAWAWRPADAQTARAFGIGYARAVTCRRELKVTHTLSAPPGDRSFVVDEVELYNRTGAPLPVTHYEVWDVNRHYLDKQLLYSGVVNPGGPAFVDQSRAELNGKLTTSASSDDVHARILNRLTDPSGAPPPEAPAFEDLYPPDVFLAALDGAGQDRFITDGAGFWGASGTPDHPANLSAGALAPVGGLGQPGILVAARDLTLPPGAAVTLRYAFGNVPPDAPLPDFDGTALTDGLDERRRALVYLDAGDEALKRELAWHAYYLGNLGGRSSYFEHAVVNQGSAYYYLQGLDGAVRDFVFSAAALTYVDPALARETLLTCARMRRESDMQLIYATTGAGELSGVGLHEHPSDLDLFFWWGVAEYVFATGDRALLDDLEPLWPKAGSTPRPMSEHVRLAARHLLDVTGLGPHGLIHVSDGDWDDGIVLLAADRNVATQTGESVANTAMAVLVAPWAAALLEGADPSTAAELRAFADQQRTALAAQWTGEWYRRAWFAADQPFGDDALYVLPNAFALAADAPTPDQAATLVAQMKQHLEDPSSTSIEQSWFRNPPPGAPGAMPYNGSNPAITSLAIWGYAHAAPERAWAAFLASTMARKADAFPDVWYGIWSGPDAQYTSATPELAGQTWMSLATAQTDFPVMNSNAHAGVLLGLWRALGIEPVVRGGAGCLRIAPRAPGPVRLDAPLVRLEVAANGDFHGEYRPVADGNLCLVLGSPEVIQQLPMKRGTPFAFAGSVR